MPSGIGVLVAAHRGHETDYHRHGDADDDGQVSAAMTMGEMPEMIEKSHWCLRAFRWNSDPNIAALQITSAGRLLPWCPIGMGVMWHTQRPEPEHQ